MLEILFKALLTLLAIFFIIWIWTRQIDVVTTAANFVKNKTKQLTEWIATREPNKIYQNGKIVGIVSGEVQEKDGKLIFLEIFDTAELNRNATFEYRKERAKIINIGIATGMYSSASNEGSQVKQNVIQNVTCERVK